MNTYYKIKAHADADGCGSHPKYSDLHWTPTETANRIVEHFAPTGRVLEPAAAPGEGGYISHPAFTDWCEVRSGRNFFDFNEPVDWIITNPPYSIIAQFEEHSMRIAQNVVFGPVKIDALGSGNKRWRMPTELGFYLREAIILPKQPPPFPQTGFQYFAFHWSKEPGPTVWTDWRKV